MVNKKIPIRTCLGCGEPKEKKVLIRVVRTPEGEILLDSTGKKSGRGAYVCPNPECLQKAKRAKKLERSFGCEIPEAVYQTLDEQLKGGALNG